MRLSVTKQKNTGTQSSLCGRCIIIQAGPAAGTLARIYQPHAQTHTSTRLYYWRQRKMEVFHTFPPKRIAVVDFVRCTVNTLHIRCKFIVFMVILFCPTAESSARARYDGHGCSHDAPVCWGAFKQRPESGPEYQVE